MKVKLHCQFSLGILLATYVTGFAPLRMQAADVQEVIAAALGEFRNGSIGEAQAVLLQLELTKAGAGGTGIDLSSQIRSVYEGSEILRNSASGSAVRNYNRGMLVKRLSEADIFSARDLSSGNQVKLGIALDAIAAQHGLAWARVLSGKSASSLPSVPLVPPDESESNVVRPYLATHDSAGKSSQSGEAYRLGLAKFLKGDLDGAIADSSRAIDLNPTNALAHVTRASAKFNKGDLGGAIADSSRAIELDPKNALAYVTRAYAKINSGDPAGGDADNARAIELVSDPGLGLILYLDRGLAAKEKGDLDEAIADFSRAIDLDEGNASIYLERASVRLKNGSLDGALADCTRVIQLDPENSTAFSLRAKIKDERGDLDDAVADYSRAIEINPESALLYESRAALHFLTQSWTNALADLRVQCELDAKEPDYAQFFIWIIRSRLGEGEAADKELADYSSKRWNSASDEWSAKIASLLLGKTSESDFLALAASLEAEADREHRCEAWYYAGMMRLLSNDPATASSYFRKCVATEVTGCVEYRFATKEL